MTHEARDLYVIGAGGHAREVHAYLADMQSAGWRGSLRGFLDDALAPGMHGRLNVLGPLSADGGITFGASYLTALGSNSTRRAVAERASKIFGSAWTLIHPRAVIGEDVEIGEGGCVAPGAILTASIRIGRHAIVNVKASVSHDCSVGDFVNINPAATLCGWVHVGEGAFIGAGATVKDRVTIGAWSVIGAGAVVTRDIPAHVTAVGVPARVIKRHE